MEQAHIPLGIFGWYGGDGGTEQNLRKPRRDREDDGTQDQTEIGDAWKQGRDEGVDGQACRGDEGHDLNDLLGIEIFGEEGENEVDGELGAEIGQHQGAEQGVGNAVGLPQGDEQEGRHAEDRGHGEVCRVAGQPRALVVGLYVLHDVSPLWMMIWIVTK